jgi:glycosyltransferase involved in cell wall biosynthesis
MRCLIVVPSLLRAGAETQAVDLANGLAARGHTIHLCCFERQLDQRERLSKKVQFHHIERRAKYDFSLITKLAAIIDREDIEVVQGVLAFATLVGYLASVRARKHVPVVGAMHTTVHRNRKDALYDRLIYRRVLRRLSAVGFVCRQQRDHWVRKYPELERLAFVVHNGVAPERFRRQEFVESAKQLRKAFGIPEKATVFASIAAFRPEKGHNLLIEAFSRLPDNAFLVLAGDGEKRGVMERFVSEIGLTDRVRFLGNIPDTRPLIATSQATVLASTAVETFSMAMLESMAMGVPMIAPVIGGLPEAIVHGSTGLLFPVGNVAELAECMRFVLENPEEGLRMGQLAEMKVAREFTLTQMVEKSEDVLSGVIHL